MVRMLARLTDDDNREFQDSYGRVSEWDKQHDKSEDTNFVAPTVTELEEELEKVRTWHNGLRAIRMTSAPDRTVLPHAHSSRDMCQRSATGGRSLTPACLSARPTVLASTPSCLATSASE